MKTFSELGVASEFCQALGEMGIITPTAIQTNAIPFLLEKDTDLIAQAQTGTGKTAAFGLPLLAKIDPAKKEIQGLIVVPTRELAKQIGKQLFRFTKFSAKIFIEVLCGGDNIDKQVQSLQRPTHIIVVTPGRLIDLLKRRALSLSSVRYLVLDEADEILSMGFKKELQEIFQQVRQRRSTWLFSATIPPGIEQLTREHMASHAPLLKVDRVHVVNRNIKHEFLVCGKDEKLERLVEFLKNQDAHRGLILQKDRDKVMRSFKKERVQFLVATDVAARGIDVEDLAFVVHHQLPEQIEYYTHRSGRTARAGKTGVSLVLLDPRERHKIRELEDSLGIHFTETR